MKKVRKKERALAKQVAREFGIDYRDGLAIGELVREIAGRQFKLKQPATVDAGAGAAPAEQVPDRDGGGKQNEAIIGGLKYVASEVMTLAKAITALKSELGEMHETLQALRLINAEGDKKGTEETKGTKETGREHDGKES